MVRKLIGGNKTGVSGIYEPDENTELTVAYEDLNNYTFDQDSPLNIRNLGNGAIGDLYINQDETQVYLTSVSSDTINQYNLSGTDVNPAYYHSKQFFVGFQDGNPQDIFFKDDGTVMYVVGDTAVAPLVANGEYVYQYTLSTAWDISTAAYSTAFSVTTQTSTVANGLFIGDSGTKMYVCNNTVVYQYTLGTAWDVSTATYASKSYTVSGQDSLANALSFKDDGTKMFVLGDTNNRVYQYTLGTAWDVSTASFVSSYLHGNEALPTGLYIGSSGTKMYIIGTQTTRQVHEYRMSVAWDISTAYYTRNYFDLLDPSFVPNSTESSPRGIGFKTDGTQIYLIGSQVDRVWQFPLTTAWDIRTVDVTPSHFIGDVENGPSGLYLSDDGRYAYTQGTNKITQFRMSTPWDITSIPYDTDIFYVGYQDTSPQDIFFKDDGTEMYVVGQSAVAPLVAASEYVHQYTLGTAWDITTASYTASFQVTTQTGTSPWGVFIGDSGTKMYVNTGVTVYQYTLGTAWDVSTATYSTNSYTYSVQEGNARSVAFKPDGTKMYITGLNSDAMFQYTLGTAWDVSTASYDSKYYWFGYIGEGAPQGINFKDDGTKVYISGTDRDGVLSFTLGTAWDISTATYDNQALGTFGYDSTPNGVFLKSDGTRVYIVGDDGDNVVSLKLSTAWDLSSATVSSVLIPNSSSNGQSIVFKPDGTKLYTYDINSDFIQQYFLTSPWNVSTIYYDYKWRTLRFYDNSITALAFKNDGTRFYVAGQDRDRALTFPLETPWEVSPYFNNYSMRFIEAGSRDLYFKPDGTKVYVVGERTVLPGLTFEGDYVHEFSLNTPWNLNTVGYTTSVGVGTALETSPQGLFFKDDGTKMYVVGINSDRVYQYALSTPWSVSSASYENKNISVTAQDTNPRAVYIGAAGTAMYIAGDSNDRVFQYTLGTAWDVSTSTYTGNSYLVSSQENQLQSVWFKDDGTRMYVVGLQIDRVYQYSLGTAWDITTASYDRKSLPLTYGQNLESNPYGLAFKDDGTKLYIVGDFNHRIFEIPLETAWDIENASIDTQFNVPIGSSTYGFDFRTYSVSTVETDPQGLFFKNDGTTMYVVGQTAPSWAGAAGLTTNADYVHQFSLGTAWDVNTVGYTTSFFVTHSSVAPAEFVPTDMYIGAAGTAMYILSDTANALYQYTLSTPWSVGTASTTVGITSISLNNLGISTTFRETIPTGLTFKPDGTKFYVLGTEKDTVFQYSLSTAWDITTASIETQFYIGSTEGTPHAIDFSSDGTLMYVTGSSSGFISEFQLSTAWDVSTAFVNSFSLFVEGGIRGLYFKPDGTSIYSVTISNDHIVQIDLKEPYKLFPPATKTLNTLITGNLTVSGIELSPDLQRLYLVGSNTRGLYKFDFNP